MVLAALCLLISNEWVRYIQTFEILDDQVKSFLMFQFYLTSEIFYLKWEKYRAGIAPSGDLTFS